MPEDIGTEIAVRATVVTETRVDPDTGQEIESGQPTRAELREINKRFARKPLSPERVYILPVVMSGTGIDSYGTHQHISSLRNYREDVRTTDAIPMLLNHGHGSIEPVGRWFAAKMLRVDKEARTDNGRAYLDTVGTDGRELRQYLGKHYQDTGYRLQETGYLVRGTSPNGSATEDLIERIDAGIQRDTSIQFTLNPALAVGSYYGCDVCGLNLFDSRCEHIPLVRYEDPYEPDSTVMATASIVNARQVEGSLVWRGAYPHAFIERASRLFESGAVGSRDIAFLEHTYGARIRSARVYSYGKEIGTTMDTERAEQTAAEPQEDVEQTEPEAQPQKRATEPEAPVFDVAQTLERATEPELDDSNNAELEPEPVDVEALEREIETLRQEYSALADQISASVIALGVAAPERAEDSIRVLGVLASEGVASRTKVIGACVEERVRARGSGFDSAAYRSRLARFTLEELEQERADLVAESRSAWSAERQTEPEIERREGAQPSARLTSAQIYALRGA